MIRFGQPRFLFVLTVTAVLALGALCMRPRHFEVPATAQSLQPRLVEVTSSSVSIAWPRVRDMRGVRDSHAAEPGPDRNRRPPGAVQVARLPASAAGHRLSGLAPGADYFIRVELETEGSGVEGINLHARTPGGPRATLDGPVRSVHLVAPDTLMVVVVDVDGGSLSGGSWQVTRRGGGAIRVDSVHRHSLPVAQPEYEVGYGTEQDIDEVQVDHRMFLRLAEPVPSPSVIEVRGPEGVVAMLPFSDRYLETPVVQLNQVGYSPRARRRWAYVSQWMGDGGGLPLRGFPNQAEVLRVTDDAFAIRSDVAARVPISARKNHDGDTGTEVRQIDLKDVPASEDASYRIRVPGVGVSYRTAVSEAAVFNAFYVTARGLFHNRYGAALERAQTDWVRPEDHVQVFTSEVTRAFTQLPEGTPQRGQRELRGGHHDAGDFDIRPTHTVVAQLLLRAFELAPQQFTDRQLRLPESGNGIPDLLDEALWSIAAWEQLQESDGGVRAGVESHREPWGIYFAHEDPLPYFTFARDAKVTARAAGLFAQAARLVKPFDAPRAQALQERAVRAFAYAERARATAPYLIYGASELFRLTDDDRYKQSFERSWRSIGPEGVFNRWALEQLNMDDYIEDGRVMPDFVLGYLGSERADPALHRMAVQWITRDARQVIDRVLGDEHAHRNPRRVNPDWGRASVPGRYLDPIYARLALGGLSDNQRQQFIDTLSISADYVFGANPLGMSFITGLGTVSPREPLHLDSLAWLKRGRDVVPGIPVYGPVTEMPGAEYYQPGRRAFHPAFEDHPLMLRYADIRTFVNMNEFSVWECQAPHVEHLALLIGAGPVP